MSNYGPQSQAVVGDYNATCHACQKPFRTDHPRQLYCSTPCKRHAQNQRYYTAHRTAVIEMAKAYQQRRKEKRK